MTHAAHPDPDASHEAVLQERARALARPMPTRRAADRRMLGFTAADQHYLVPLADVGEVVPGSRLARVPHGRPPLLGVATHRSSLLAVFALDRTSAGHTAPPWMIVVGAGPDRLAVAADEVIGMEHLDDDELLKTDQDESDTVPVTALRRRDGAAVLDVELLLASDQFTIEHDTPSPLPSDHP